MLSIKSTVKKLSFELKHAPNSRQLLDKPMQMPEFHTLFNQMNAISLKELGITGPDDPYHFQNSLNRVTDKDANEDQRIVIFFIKKGTRMPLHDHPNMCVLFR